jgi:hypothetical protein
VAAQASLPVEVPETKTNSEAKPENHDEQPIVTPEYSEVRTSHRTRRPYNEWREDVIPYTTMKMEAPPIEPSTFAEAINCDNKKEWNLAMQDEIDSLVPQGTWKLVDASKGAKIISIKWVYKVKMIHGKFERFKCRVVAKGFMQVYGVNYFQTDAHVASLMPIRLVTTEAFMRDM